MQSETKRESKALHATAEKEKLKPAPMLYAIILFKTGKGALFLFAGLILYWRAANGLTQEYQWLMHTPFVEWIFRMLRIHPENQFFENLALKIENLTEASVRNAALGTIIWSLFPLVEGLGMMARVAWAGWLAIGESAFFVPIEFFELTKRFSWPLLVVTISNIIIVWYLYVNRERLFHHHHRGNQRKVNDEDASDETGPARP